MEEVVDDRKQETFSEKSGNEPAVSAVACSVPAPVDMVLHIFQQLHADTFAGCGEISMWGHTLMSLRRVGLGLLFATLIGIPFGTFIGWNSTFRALFQPLFEMIRPIPPLAWVPLITVWFGIGETPKVILVFIGTFTPIVVNTYSGVRLASPENIEVGRMFGAKGLRLLSDIVMPSALPAIMAGLKTALTTGWGVVLAAEMISANSGLGMLVTRGSDSGDLPLTILSMIIIGIVGALMSAVFTVIERKLSPWRIDIN